MISTGHIIIKKVLYEILNFKVKIKSEKKNENLKRKYTANNCVFLNFFDFTTITILAWDNNNYLQLFYIKSLQNFSYWNMVIVYLSHNSCNIDLIANWDNLCHKSIF